MRIVSAALTLLFLALTSVKADSNELQDVELFQWHFPVVGVEILVDEMLKENDLAIFRVRQVAENQQSLSTGKAVIRAAVDIGMILKQDFLPC